MLAYQLSTLYQLFYHFWLTRELYVSITHGTEWPILCWCAVKQLLIYIDFIMCLCTWQMARLFSHSWPHVEHKYIFSRLKLLKLLSAVAEDARFTSSSRMSASAWGNMARIAGTMLLSTSQQLSSDVVVVVMAVATGVGTVWNMSSWVWNDRPSHFNSGYCCEISSFTLPDNSIASSSQ